MMPRLEAEHKYRMRTQQIQDIEETWTGILPIAVGWSIVMVRTNQSLDEVIKGNFVKYLRSGFVDKRAVVSEKLRPLGEKGLAGLSAHVMLNDRFSATGLCVLFRRIVRLPHHK